MPTPKSRNGNVFVESGSFTKCHGVTPSSCDVTTEALVQRRLGDVLVMNIGGSHWLGRWSDTRARVSESTGLVSRLQATDFRDDLFSVVVFAQFNMLDRETGEVYSIIEGVDDPDIEYSGSGLRTGLGAIISQFRDTLRSDIRTFREKLRSDIQYFRDSIYNSGEDPSSFSYSSLAPAVFRSYDPMGWILQAPRYGWINSKDIIEFLCALCGFKCVFSTEALIRLNASATSDWYNSRFNCFNLDWNTGSKVAPALNEVLDRLGLQVSIRMDWSRTLEFTLKGEGSYSSFVWNGTQASEGEDGLAVQSDVDTGVWIVGDRTLYECNELPLIPDWNQSWNEIYLDGGSLALRDLFEAHSLSPVTARLIDLPEEYHDDQWHDGKPRNEMLATDYMNTFPYKCYRIEGMELILSETEFTGEDDVTDAPISTPLVSDPSKQYILKANIWDPDKVTLTVEPPEFQEMFTGHRLDERSGRVWFDEDRFRISSEFTSEDLSDLLPEHILVDEPTIQCVFKSAVYREFFGTTERVGVKHVPGLRKTFIIDDIQADIDGAEEYVQEEERSPDLTAADVAAAYLGRQRYVRSGSQKFDGVAGHETSGEIQRVTVNVDANSGITEQVSYANDESNPDYDPQLELQRKLVTTQLTRDLARINSDRRDAVKYASWLRAVQFVSAGGKEERLKTMHQRLVEMAMRAGGSDVKPVSNTDKGTSDGAFSSGEPVAAEMDATTGRLKTVAYSTLIDGDTRIIGIGLRKIAQKSKWMSVATGGTVQALVKGPVVRGDALTYDKTNCCLKEGTDGAKFTAEEDYAEATPAKKLIRLAGGGGGETNTILARVATTANITLSGTQTIDGITVAVDDVVLVKNQTSTQNNGPYFVKSTAWTRYSTSIVPGVLVAIRQGTTNGKKLFELVTSGPITLGITLLTFEECSAGGASSVYSANAATTANITLSGSQTVDGVLLTAGATCLVKNQSTSSQNGFYTVAAGAWTKGKSFTTTEDLSSVIIVRGGTTQGETMWWPSSANTFKGAGGFYK